MCECSGLKELELRFNSDHSRGDSFFFFIYSWMNTIVVKDFELAEVKFTMLIKRIDGPDM